MPFLIPSPPPVCLNLKSQLSQSEGAAKTRDRESARLQRIAEQGKEAEEQAKAQVSRCGCGCEMGDHCLTL